MSMFSFPNPWYAVKDGDPRAFELMKRHYSYHPYVDGRRQRPGYRNRFLFVGPGEKIVLLTSDCKALFVWRKFISKDNQAGVNCAVFHNESKILSSELILKAEEIAAQRWPGERLYTYVNSKKIKSTNPGYCFIKANWKRIGHTKKLNLVILAKEPNERLFQ